MMKHVLMLVLLIAFLLLSMVIFTGVGVHDTQPEGPDAENAPAKEATVRVVVKDETRNKPLHDRAELLFRGLEPWHLKAETRASAAEKDLGRRTIDERQEGPDGIALYPDGRDAPQVLIPFVMTEARPAGVDQDRITITIRDDEIEATGRPIETATGQASLKVKRSE